MDILFSGYFNGTLRDFLEYSETYIVGISPNRISLIPDGKSHLLDLIESNPSIKSQLLSVVSAAIARYYPFAKNVYLSTHGNDILINYTIGSLKVLSFNLGFNVMNNIPIGSEAKAVKVCQNRYQGGWHLPDKKISACTHNAAELIREYSLFGLQEVSERYLSILEAVINGNGTRFQFISGYKGLLIGYDPLIAGPGVALTSYHFMIPIYKAKDNRGFQAVWFSKMNLVFVNLHAPHGIDLKVEIERCCKMINIHPQRVIMTGDFNDYRGTLLTEKINAFGITIRIPGSKKVLTCCTDTGWIYPGDYILTNEVPAHYGYPSGYTRGDPPMSDHDPIELIT